MQCRRALVTGAGGFIGHHLVRYLVAEGFWVRGVDIKYPEFEPSPAHEFATVDLRRREVCGSVVRGVNEVYHLAADMGGIGYISENHASIATNNVLMDTHMLQTAAEAGVNRFFYASSACVYPMHLQQDAAVTPLKEQDAWPADPEEGYGLEKLYAEKLCEYYQQDALLETRVARFHNVYGPLGTYQGGREKAPAAICRKIALASDGDEIEIWGDGKQTRSFMFVDDCVEGIVRIARSERSSPLNLGRDELVSIDELVDLVIEVSGKAIRKNFDRTRPQGVRGRNSDNNGLLSAIKWQPSVTLAEGVRRTYEWIQEELRRTNGASPRTPTESVRLSL